MRSGPLTRRSLLVALGLGPLTGCIVGGNPPLPHTRIRAVTLDVGPIAAQGLTGWAEKVAAAGRPALTKAFADILAPNDPKGAVVTVRVDQIHLAAGTGDDGSPFGIGDKDEARGRLDVAPVDGLPALSRDLRATRSPADAGPWYTPGFDDRRLAGLMDLFAIWARREFAP